jgi:hypothetical protein
MLLDDILRNDECRLGLAGFLSDKFSLIAGTAQGRKLSVDLFNCLVRQLYVILEQVSAGVAVTCDPSLRDSETLATTVATPSSIHYDIGIARTVATRVAD